MKTDSPFLSAMLVMLWLLVAAGTSMPAQAQSQSLGFSYTPPLRGAPSSASRVGGGTRGIGQNKFSLSVLAPEHVGHTSLEQPTLYWFCSEDLSAPVEVTIVDGSGIETLMELTLNPPIEAGVHSLDLAKHGVRLELDKIYQWYVAVVVDEKQRSNDIVAAGELLRVAPPVGMAGSSIDVDMAAAYAKAGIWYDTIHSLSIQMSKNPKNDALRAQRADLLSQVGLEKAADFERAKN